MSYKLTGKIKLINDTVQVTDKFAKREFVVTDSSSMYEQDILFQAVQDKCSMLDGYSEGDQVEVSFNLRGREWVSPSSEVKYFNTLDAWRIEKLNSNDPHGNEHKPMIEPISAEDSDDIPF